MYSHPNDEQDGHLASKSDMLAKLMSSDSNLLLLVESVVVLLTNLRLAATKQQILAAVCGFYHSVTGHSVIGTSLRVLDAIVTDLRDYGIIAQSGFSWIDVCDQLHTNVKRVIKCKLGRKIIGLINHVVAMCLFKKMGIEFDHEFFGKIEKKHITPTIWNVVSFIDGVIGLIIYICKTGRQCILMRSIEPFFIDGQVACEWFEKASRLRKDAEFLGNPTAVNMELPLYLAEIKDCIKVGKQLCSAFKGKREHTMVFNILLELEMIEKRHQVSLLAASLRRAPVCLLIAGTAGVAKSFIAKGLFNHYCSIRKITGSSAHMWTKADTDKFYSGYQSHYAGVLLDDAAKYRPDVVQGVDPTIGDFISIANNVQFVTPQAEAQDKGKIPFLSEWVGVTTNIETLNANLVFNCAAAFYRRFAMRITPFVKPEFQIPGEGRIDTSMIPDGEQYPDLWTFHVEVPRIKGDAGGFEMIMDGAEPKKFSYSDLLEYCTDVYEKHIAQQDRFMKNAATVPPEELCACRLPKSLCACVEEETSALGLFNPESQAGHVAQDFEVQNIRLYENTLKATMMFYSDKIERMMVKQLFSQNRGKLDFWQEPEAFVKALTPMNELVRTTMKGFSRMTPVEKLNMVGNTDIFNKDFYDDEYLDFEPELGPPGYFIRTHLKLVRDTILNFAPHLSDEEKSVLDAYLYDRVPKYIAAGWTTKSIIRGALCYIRKHTGVIVDADRLEARNALLDEHKLSWTTCASAWFAEKYLESEWVFRATNYVATSRFGRFTLGVAFYLFGGKSIRARLVDAGKSFDKRLGGSSPYVKSLLAVVGAAGLVAMLYCLIKPLLAPKVQAQLDVSLIGKKPTVRETEKKNVWVVPERTITKLDVSPRVPHNEAQAESLLKNNVLMASVRGTFPMGDGNSTTRVLAIDSRTIVMNNHALPKAVEGNLPVDVTLWFGPRSDQGVQPSTTLRITEDMLRREPERDLVVIHTNALPRRFRSIRNMLVQRTYQSEGPSAYFVKMSDDSVTRLECYGARRTKLKGMQGAPEVLCDAWSVKPSRPTEHGECGAPLVVSSPIGSVIVGLHCGYHARTNTAFSFPIYADDFEECFSPQLGVTEISGVLAQMEIIPLKATDKLYTDYHKDGRIMTHGQVKGFNSRPKFTGRKTEHAAYVFSRGQEFSPPITDCMAAPVAGSWEQPQMVLKNYLQPTHSMNEMILRACREAMCAHIKLGLRDEDWADIHPVPIEVAINGFPGVPNVDAQKFTTSAGHGRRGPKLRYMTEPESFEEWDSFRRLDAPTLAAVQKIRDDAENGIRPHAIYDACFKDEMLSKAKVAAGRARVIYMCPLPFLTNMRMSVMGICRVMIRRRHLFGMAIGLNTHSEEWDELFQLASRLPGDNWVAGDFKAFESVLSLLICNEVSEVITFVARESGNFDCRELSVLETLLADISNPTINFFGELITLLGGEASGHQLTTPFNCIANRLLHMYAYVVTKIGDNNPYAASFTCAMSYFDDVEDRMLGDDVYLKVHPRCPEFNHTSIMHVFEGIGITYTMADKLAESVPYISWSDVTFLKRSFVEHSQFPGMKVAALDKKSIYKMLCYYVPSKGASYEEQIAACFCSAQAEAFFHDREFFDQIWRLIEDIPKSMELQERMRRMRRPTWAQMTKRFLDASPKLKARWMMLGVYDAEITYTEDSYYQFDELELQCDWRVDPWCSTTMGRSPEERIYAGIGLSPKFVPKLLANEEWPVVENTFFSKNFKKTQEPKPSSHIREMTPVKNEKVINKAMQKVLDKRRKAHRREKWIVAQADISYDTSQMLTAEQPAQDVQHETTAFRNEPGSDLLTFGEPDTTLADCTQMEQELAKYLSRPKLIKSYEWVENDSNGIKLAFSPWFEFFNDSNMTEKIGGFRYLRCNLHLRFMVNGSPFYYGALLANYTPMHGTRRDTATYSNVNMSLIPESQKPHVWLENQKMSTTEMVLPFLYPYPYIETRSNPLTAMGRIKYIQYVPLKSANGTTGQNIDIQCYAWATDIQFSGPTDLPVMQSEFKPDGQISSVASTVADVASSLEAVPFIGPYASATAMAASSIGKVASFFGFTNVPNVSDVQPIKQVPFSLASCEISEPVTKLSLQAKQETAIGSKQHGGSGEDELVLSRFAGRSSFLAASAWNTTDATGTPVFTCGVCPELYDYSVPELANTPMSFISNFFSYWRGSIKFTFKVVRSPYHRGRLQIAWDAGASDLSQGPTIGNPNSYTTIMDLDEKDECTVVIPYMKHTQFIPTQWRGIGGSNGYWSVSPTPSGSVSRANGVLSVRVLNRLSAPISSALTTILVFVSAGEDFELAAPREWKVDDGSDILSWSNATAAVAQADIKYDDSDVEHHFNTDKGHGPLYKEVFGERVVSLREWLHRSSLAFVAEVERDGDLHASKGLARVTIPIKHIPPAPGVLNNGWWTGQTASGPGQTVNYTKWHPILAISSCFLGYKGSVNVTVNVNQPELAMAIDDISITRAPMMQGSVADLRRPYWELLLRDTWTGSGGAQRVRETVNAISSGVQGRALTNTKTNAGISANLPFYSNNGFFISDFSEAYNNQASIGDSNNDWFRIEWTYPKFNTTETYFENAAMTSVYYGTGPDWDAIFFVNVPIMFNVAVTTT